MTSIETRIKKLETEAKLLLLSVIVASAFEGNAE